MECGGLSFGIFRLDAALVPPTSPHPNDTFAISWLTAGVARRSVR
jgi:hypothetical protein